MRRLLSRAPSTPMALLGGARLGVLEKIRSKHSLSNVRLYSPPFRAPSPESVREDLSLAGVFEHRPRWIWVGLGAPKQELWMQLASKIYPDAIYFGVGAAFDFLSGEKVRAPSLVRSLGLEWAHRWMSEPRRLSGRYLKSNTKFLIRSLLKRR
jgi:N-acetylglucosaminyldiphosphoundecaprenol N-acetyl-beta-D-mannosaminyltransferase